MRIGSFNSAAGELASELSSQQVSAQNAVKAGQTSGEDRATLSSDSTSFTSLVGQALASPEIRQAKVDDLRLAVNGGQYAIDPKEIASSLIDEHA